MWHEPSFCICSKRPQAKSWAAVHPVDGLELRTSVLQVRQWAALQHAKVDIHTDTVEANKEAKDGWDGWANDVGVVRMWQLSLEKSNPQLSNWKEFVGRVESSQEFWISFTFSIFRLNWWTNDTNERETFISKLSIAVLWPCWQIAPPPKSSIFSQ